MMGAAVATIAAYTTMFVGMAWWAQRIYPVPYQWRRVATAAGAGVALVAAGKLAGGGLARRAARSPSPTRSRCSRSASTSRRERKAIGARLRLARSAQATIR